MQWDNTTILQWVHIIYCKECTLKYYKVKQIQYYKEIILKTKKWSDRELRNNIHLYIKRSHIIYCKEYTLNYYKEIIKQYCKEHMRKRGKNGQDNFTWSLFSYVNFMISILFCEFSSSSMSFCFSEISDVNSTNSSSSSVA